MLIAFGLHNRLIIAARRSIPAPSLKRCARAVTSLWKRRLEAALCQFGPGSQTADLAVTPDLLDKMPGQAIDKVEWPGAADDVRRF